MGTSIVKSISRVTSASIIIVAARASVATTGQVDKDAFRALYTYEKPSDFLRYLDDVAVQGNFESVVKSSVRFASVYPMYALSQPKAEFLASLVDQAQPKAILEIGSFFGFSAIHLAKAMPEGCTLTCIEGNEENVEVARAVIKKAFAGSRNEAVLDRINIITGLSSTVLKSADSVDALLHPHSNSKDIKRKQQEQRQPLLDFVFMDHDKAYLLPDLKILEDKGFLSSSSEEEGGCTVVADNVVYPGAPLYLEYVNAKRRYKESESESESESERRGWETTLHPFAFERVGFETGFKMQQDAMSVSIKRKKKKRTTSERTG
jgi:catechol O-methyltransferase